MTPLEINKKIAKMKGLTFTQEKDFHNTSILEVICPIDEELSKLKDEHYMEEGDT
jgi:hypothetical protein